MVDFDFLCLLLLSFDNFVGIFFSFFWPFEIFSLFGEDFAHAGFVGVEGEYFGLCCGLYHDLCLVDGGEFHPAVDFVSGDLPEGSGLVGCLFDL